MVRVSTVIALAGADLGGIEQASRRRLVPGRTYHVEAGSTVSFPGSPAGDARLYLALAGGIDVPHVLGSASTLVAAGMGGHEGRAVAAGDVIAAGLRGHVTAGVAGVAGRIWPGPVRPPGDEDGALRFVRGPGAGRLGPAAIAALEAGPWTVTSASDRMGARLDGPPLPIAPAEPLLSHGVPSGAIQVPPDGRPIILLADHQTTGGYPVVGVVISADLPAAGQLRPGAAVRLREVSLAAARSALLAQRAAWETAVTSLAESAGWDELWRSAGG
jgi:antagonist of KipI